MKEKYRKENLEKIVKESYSIADVIRSLGMKPRGTNYDTIKKYITLYNLDTNHFTGQAWNRGKSYTELTGMIPLEDILKPDVSYKSSRLLKRLVEAGLKEYRCECCECNDSDLTLELHHINGDHYDNRLENLQILCPNCHSKTDNYRKPKSSIKDRGEGKLLGTKRELPTYVCKQCGKEFKADRHDKERKFCSVECYHKYINLFRLSDIEGVCTNSGIPDKHVLEEVCKQYSNMTSLGKHFNVSRVTARKWLNQYDLYEDFKMKYDFHACAVLQYSMDGILIKEWPSISDAEECLHCRGGISKCIEGKRRSAGGFLWKKK